MKTWHYFKSFRKPVKGKHLAFYSFFAGLIRLDKKKTSDELKAKRIIIHPDHTLTSENSDISIIELNRKLKLNKKIVPICLPGKGIFLVVVRSYCYIRVVHIFRACPGHGPE